MNINFYTKGDKSIKDLIDYIENQIEKHPNCEIYIGTDSQRFGPINKFVTVIAFRYGKRGVHFIYNRKTMPLHPTVKNKLRHEVELTVECYYWLKTKLPNIKICAVEADINEDKRFKSNEYFSEGRGGLEGLVSGEGVLVLTKPQEQVAVKAANQLLQ